MRECRACPELAAMPVAYDPEGRLGGTEVWPPQALKGLPKREHTIIADGWRGESASAGPRRASADGAGRGAGRPAA